MRVAGRPMRTIWLAADEQTVEIVDQTRLPHELAIVRLTRLDDAARAIADMQVRGAPLIGATAAYGVALAMLADPSDRGIDAAVGTLARRAEGHQDRDEDPEYDYEPDQVPGQENASDPWGQCVDYVHEETDRNGQLDRPRDS